VPANQNIFVLISLILLNTFAKFIAHDFRKQSLNSPIMTKKEIFLLNDPFTEPTDKYLKDVLKDKYEWLQTIRKYTLDNHGKATEEWKYYNDVKQWLFRLKYKKETICWIGILPDTFRITFYFGNKFETVIDQSDLPESIKSEYMKTREQHYRPISLIMNELTDIVIVCKLIELKLSKY
jgi:hypothetical protein